MQASPAQRAALTRLAAELAAAAGPALPGTLTVRAYAYDLALTFLRPE